MQFYLATAVLLLFCSGVLLVVRWPQVSLAIFLGLYAAEQILMANFPLFRQFGSLYNYFVGAICIFSIVVSVVKFGIPRIIRTDLALFTAFFLLVSLSLLWTVSPISAKFAYTHFALEATLAFLLPMFVIRKKEDLKVFLIYLVGFGLLTSLSLIFIPKAGIGGRMLLVEGGTVLSPATLSGSCIILLATMSKESLGDILYKFRFGIILLLALGCFLSGARTQFYISIFLALFSLVFLFGKYKLKMIGSLIGSGIMVLFIAYLVLPSDFWEVIIRVAGRYDSDQFDTGLNQRVSMIESILGSNQVLLGNGLMSWGFLSTGLDVYVYPHNSLAQIYYEIGLVGLFLFVMFLAASFFSAKRVLKLSKKTGWGKEITWSFILYLLYGLILSFKQGTFMSCLEVYVGVSMLGTFCIMSEDIYKARRREARRKQIQNKA